MYNMGNKEGYIKESLCKLIFKFLNCLSVSICHLNRSICDTSFSTNS